MRSQHELRLGLTLPFPLGRQWTNLAQIVRLEGLGNYTLIHFLDGTTLLVALSLKVFMGRVPVGVFVRPHRKHLLNRQHIETVSARHGNILLTNGERIPIARRRVTEFRRVG
ncbi:MAG: LytTR family transcriptional regulator [Cytophagales bacterium]|nr:MAG: LytTR family transcriptional regulator [Cytophagales bacterium]